MPWHGIITKWKKRHSNMLFCPTSDRLSTDLIQKLSCLIRRGPICPSYSIGIGSQSDAERYVALESALIREVGFYPIVS